jgi:hypothetical protein
MGSTLQVTRLNDNFRFARCSEPMQRCSRLYLAFYHVELAPGLRHPPSNLRILPAGLDAK